MKEKSKNHPDYILFATLAVLIFLGILILASVSAIFSQQRFGFSTYFLSHQILFGLIPGSLLGFIAFKIPISFLRKRAHILLLVSLFLMVLCFLPPIGISFRGAHRWINLGTFSLQPSEFLKISFFVYLAAWLSGRSEKDKKIGGQRKEIKKLSQTLIAFFIIIGLISLLLGLQPDVSTLAIIILVAVFMYFLAETPLLHTIFLALITLTLLVGLIKIAPYRFNRLLVFLNPEIDPMGMSYQIKQALIAVGSGGILGLGLGTSIQKFGFLPQPMSDSIFAIFAEETGFLGSLILVSLFLIFIWRGFKIGKEAPDRFSQLLALGITCWIALQGFVNIGSMTGILPLTGIPLPFISYGGSALITEFIGVGILLNISKQNL